MPKTAKKTDTILALDPGLRDLGYAVLAGRRIVTASVLPLRSVSRQRRLGRVREFLLTQVRAHRPRTLVLEHIPKRPLDTLAGLPALGRLLGRLARQRRLKLATYSARTVRGSVVGDGWAGKREVAQVIARKFPELRVHLTHDRKWKERYWQNMFDAVALALHHQAVSKPPSRSRRSG
jgi:Holliday junction resolvasome RuvABC endonuclease subunit